MARDSRAVLAGRNARARELGYRSYRQRRYWQEVRARGVCLGCRIPMPPDYSPNRSGSKLCSICNDTADPQGGDRLSAEHGGWQRRYTRLMALHRRKRGRRPGWGDSPPTRREARSVAYSRRSYLERAA